MLAFFTQELQRLSQPLFSYTNVPYRLKPYVELLKDAYNTIDFDWDLEKQIDARCRVRGSDGKLVYDPAGEVAHVALAEKLLTLLLATPHTSSSDGCLGARGKPAYERSRLGRVPTCRR